MFNTLVNTLIEIVSIHVNKNVAVRFLKCPIIQGFMLNTPDNTGEYDSSRLPYSDALFATNSILRY